MHVYILFDGFHYKIGVGKNVVRRIKQLQTGCATSIKCLAISPLMLPSRARFIEKQIQRGLRQWRLTGEWFCLNPFQLKIIKKEISSAGINHAITSDI